MLTGTYFAINARIGAIMMVGRSMRLMRDAIMQFCADLVLLAVFLDRASLGRVLRARLAPRTTKIKGTATPPDWPTARSDRVADEGTFCVEEVLKFGDRRNQDGYKHGPERWVHEFPYAVEESSKCPPSG